MTNVYKRPPLRVLEGIPVFTDMDDSYVVNYEHIATDHLQHSAHGDINPFMLQSQIDDALNTTQKLIQSYIEAGARVLDAGLGTGALLDSLDGVEKYGVDVSLSYLQKAQQKNIEVTLANIQDLPYRDRMFDVVVTTDVLEHVLLLDEAIRELHRVLKPGGILIVRVPNKENLASYADGIQGYKYSHIRDFSLDSLRLYFEKSWEMAYVDHAFSGYIFGSAGQLKLRLPNKDGSFADYLESRVESIPEFELLKKAAECTEEEVVDALISIRDNHPELADDIMPLIVEPMDVTVAFRKPDSEKTVKVAEARSEQITTFPTQGFGRIAQRPEEVLLLCYYDPAGVPTVPETVAYMQLLSDFSVTVLNMHVHRKDTGFIRLKHGLNLEAFSAIVIHNSLSYNIDNIRDIDSELETSLAAYRGVKVLMKQDENFRSRETAEYVLDVGFDIVFTCLPSEAIPFVYPQAMESGVHFERMLTGYVTPSLRSIAEVEDRPIDIGYRGSIQPLSFGRLAYEKRQIGDLVRQALDGTECKLDISSEWSDRLGGDSWLNFLSSCKATLGTESGASIFDLGGDLDSRCERADAELGPFDTSEEYAIKYLAFLEDLESNVKYHQVSPRHFEAAATKTLQLLYPGQYSGIFEPWKHYFPLEKDGSNLAEALELLKDCDAVKNIVDTAYDEIILNPEYSTENFVIRFDELVSQALGGKRQAKKSKAQTPAGHNILLLAAHEPSIDPRLGWIENFAQVPLRVHQVGVLPPETSEPNLDVSANASLSQAYPRRRWVKGLANSLFSLAGSDPAGMAGIQELSFLESALEFSEEQFAEIFGAPVGHDRNLQFKWYLQYILDTSITLIEHCMARRGIHGLIATDLDTLPAALVLKGIFDVPVFYDAHEYWPESDPASFEYETQFWMDMECRLVQHADYRQTVSPGLARLMSRQYGVDFSTVPNCEPTSSVGTVSPRVRNDETECRFLFQGNFAPHRGLELLVNAWSRTDTKAILLLRGPACEYKNKVIELAREVGLLGTRIFFPAAVPESELVAACSDGDVGLIPYEPAGTNYRHCCPNKLSQYMAAGLPVLANRTKFVSEVILDARCGSAVDFSRIEHLIDSVNLLAKDSAGRRKMGQAGRHYFQNRFNWELMSLPLYQALEAAVEDKDQVGVSIFNSDRPSYFVAGRIGFDGGIDSIDRDSVVEDSLEYECEAEIAALAEDLENRADEGELTRSEGDEVEDQAVNEIAHHSADNLDDGDSGTMSGEGVVNDNALEAEITTYSSISVEALDLDVGTIDGRDKLIVKTWSKAPPWVRKGLRPVAHRYKSHIIEKQNE